MIPATIREEIDDGLSEVFSHRNFNRCAILHYDKNNESVKIPMRHLISTYRDYFDDAIVTVDIDEEEERKYRYAPKKLSLDVYQTTQFWSIILFINECHSIIDFHPEGSVKLLDPNKAFTIVNEILILEDLI
jgi:hypothetical protein